MLKHTKKAIAEILLACMMISAVFPAYAESTEILAGSEAAEEVSEMIPEQTEIVEELVDAEVVCEAAEAVELEEDESDARPAEDPLNTEELAGSELAANEEVKLIDENTESITGTYTPENSFENDNRLDVRGNATIFLLEGQTLTYNKGIHVGPGSTLKIEGYGTLIARGEEHNAAIGANRGENAGTIIIEGGNIQATGGEEGAGIGGSWGRSGGNIMISGGNVTATGGWGGAGIGGGLSGSGSVTISGGTVTATGGEEGAGIGSGSGRGINGGTITISGGTVTAKGSVNAAGIGGGYCGNGGNVKISGGTVMATGGGRCPGIGGGHDSSGNGTLEVTKTLAQIYVNDGAEPVSQYNWENRVRIIFNVATYIDGSTVNITGNSTITSDVQNDNRLNVQGNAILVLPEGMTLKLSKGIHAGPDSTLKVEGSGTLIVTGEYGYSAGIGGNNNESAGTIIIDGRNIQVTGGANAAGIGGGSGGSGGNVTINSGTVTINGGENAAGIGGGNGGNGGNTTISGGAVIVIGGNNAAGIGGGIGGDGGNTTINGGTVYAAGGENVSAIGRGWSGSSMGTFRVGDGLSVFDTQNEKAPIRITDPTPEKLDGVMEVKIAKTVAVPGIAEGLIYNGKQQNGCINADQQHVILGGTISAVDAGTYTFTAAAEAGYSWEDGTTEKKTLSWQIAPKDVSGTRSPVTQNISAGIGKFSAPGEFRDAELGQDIPGTISYTFDGRQMTQKDVEKELAVLSAGASGSFDWAYAAKGNFTGTIKGSIRYVIHREIEFTVDGKPADATNAVIIKKNPAYGDDWSKIVTIKSDAITASLNGVKGTGSYSLNVSGTPDAGEQEYIVRFTGRFGSASYTDVIVFFDTVDVARIDYEGVTKTAFTEAEFKKGETVEITLPGVPKSADYGVPYKTDESYPFTVSGVNNGKVVLTMTKDAKDAEAAKPMFFTVPVIPDGNHNGYDITVTVNKAAIFVISQNTVDLTGIWTIESSIQNQNRLTVKGNAAIILPEGMTLDLTEGINVGPGSTLRITGSGTLKAKAGSLSCQSAIGGNKNEGTGTIIIDGGTIIATGAETGAGIGGGKDGDGGNITINGGTVTAAGGERAAGIGGGIYGNGGSVTINGGTVTATGGERAAGIGGGSYRNGSNVTINGGLVTATGGEQAPAIGGGYYSRNNGTLKVAEGRTLIYVNDGKEPVSRYNLESKVRIVCTEELYIDEHTVNITGSCTIRRNIRNGNRLNVQGSAAITLPEGMTLMIYKGIHVGPGSTLRIGGSGTLIIDRVGGYESAGIGGNSNESAGTIIIDGGKIEVEGGTFAAGIGGGNRGSGGTIIISGGIVTATDGVHAAGIGGGWEGSGGNITISGGNVTAKSQLHGAGIGGGREGSSGGNITISGGNVTASGGEYGAGIGGGWKGSGGTIIISGGSVTATGGERARGIGGGWKGAMGTLKIGDELRVFDMSIENVPILITDPTPQKLNGIQKVSIQSTTAVQAAEGLIYNGKKQNGYVNADRLHVVFGGTTSAVNAGTYTFTATPETGYRWEDGTDEKKTLSWKIAPKDVSGTRSPVTQIILEGIGKFTAPGFHDAETDQNIPGTFIYTYDGKKMTQEQVEKELAKLHAGTHGSFDWTYIVRGNFTGTIRGSIRYVIRSSEFDGDSSTSSDDDGGAVGGLSASGTPTFSGNWTVDTAGIWRIRDNSGNYVAGAWLCDDAVAANGQNVWYLMNTDGTMIAAGLVQDNTGNYYSLEMNHNGYYGMLRYKNGIYDGIYMEFSQKHDGTFGAITNRSAIDALKAKYGVTKFGIGNDRCVYTKSFE